MLSTINEKNASTHTHKKSNFVGDDGRLSKQDESLYYLSSSVTSIDGPVYFTRSPKNCIKAVLKLIT